MSKRGKVVKRIIEELKTLGNSQFETEADFVKVSSSAEDLMFAAYEAGVSNTVYTSEEKQTIGPLVPAALQGLGYKLSIIQSSFASQSLDSVRIQRSGLQFILDLFRDFPVSSEEKPVTLGETFKEFVECEDVDGLDERLKTAAFDPDCDDSERSDSFQLEITKLPSTHWWFFK